MTLFKKGQSKYEVIREGEDTILLIDYEDVSVPPSIEDSKICMATTIEKLVAAGPITKIIFKQKRDYEYDYSQTQILIEIAKLYNRLIKQKNLFSYSALGYDPKRPNETDKRYTEVQLLVLQLLKTDPVGAYVELKRIRRREKIKLEKATAEVPSLEKYISLLSYLLDILEKTKLITIAKPYLAGYKLGDREIYRNVFAPIIKPDFMFTKVMSAFPQDGEELASYSVGGNTDVTIFEISDNIQYLYHMVPPEFKLTEEKYDVLDLARKIMAEHKPSKAEYVDPQRMRQVFHNVGRDLIEELTDYKQLKFTQKEIEELTEILVRYTVGFGLIEVLLQDEKIQDITINSPMGRVPAFIVHADFGDCRTNIIPTTSEAESWASKLRMVSGRPLDEANPVLDTELVLPNVRARVAVISPPLNPHELAYAFRRHRAKPWTTPLFVKNKFMNSMAAGILSFLIDGSRTMLVAGTRSAGKTSLLGSLLVEIMRKYRVITVEDTLELPSDALRALGYNIQQMKVASALTRGTTEVPAAEGIRTTLRMGDSCLIVGEVRSTEALALYEAMRVGALANVVAGTIHGDSPYGVYDRVVNDLKVPRTSFKATDIIVVANPIRSADGMHKWRRVTQITEVRKFWEDDPLRENGFVDLMKYNSKTDELEPSDDLINGDSDILKSIAGNVKEWAGDWDAVWDNIMLRSKIKEQIVSVAEKTKDPDILEADFIVLCNDEFHKISDKVKQEVGSLDSKTIFFEWNEWLKRAIKKRAM